jgi:hypothetical protein
VLLFGAEEDKGKREKRQDALLFGVEEDQGNEQCIDDASRRGIKRITYRRGRRMVWGKKKKKGKRKRGRERNLYWQTGIGTRMIQLRQEPTQ